MAQRSSMPKILVAGGAAIAALGVLLLAQPWNGGPAPSSVRMLADNHTLIGGYRLATLYDVTDPAQVVSRSAAESPAMRLSLHPSAEGGWALDLDIAKVMLAQSPLEARDLPGQAHAHLYVDGMYHADFSARTLLLPPLAQGAHEIAVILTTTDHRAFVRDGIVLVERVALRVNDPRRGALAVPKGFELAVREGRVVSGDTLRVKQGETILLRWSSDALVDLHLEGYDLEAKISARSAAAMLFVADLPGRFPVERHTKGGGHTGGPLLYLEVYP